MNETREITIPETITVRNLAERMGISPIDLIKTLMSNGVLASINQQIDFDTAAIIAAEYGFEASLPYVEVAEEAVEEELALWERIIADEESENLMRRPPVVTVLGHVDHGKTTLLDAIRHAHVADGESGGITQHIGAYMIHHNGRPITFIDTPGHEAFTAMRARGAHTTDIAVLVVAADDGVQPQTIEAINHARAAHVPILVALNKIDRPNAQPEVVKQELADEGLMPDEWGGEVMVIPVSAKMQEGLEDLLEAILLMADEINMQANPDAPAFGTALEGKLDRRRGPVATVLIMNGTLHVGDVVVVGKTWGKVRALEDERGDRHQTTPPGVPAVILGLNDVPDAGDRLRVVEEERSARSIAEQRQDEARAAEQASSRGTMTLDEFSALIKEGETKELDVVLKTDVQGSIEPIVNSLEALGDEELQVNVVHAAAGNITESDVNLAVASNAIVLGFRVNVDSAAQRMADEEGVDINIYEIIYRLVNEVEQAMKGLLEPKYVERSVGRAVVRATFNIPSIGTIAGSYVVDGVARRNAKVRVYRDGDMLFDGGVDSLKRFEEDVREVRQGYECGVKIEGFDSVQEGDQLLFYVVEREARV